MKIDPAEYQPIPGHPDLMWKPSDIEGARGPYWILLLAKSVTAQRGTDLGARLEIVPGYRHVGILHLPSSFDISRTSIEEWLCDGGLRTRYFGSFTGGAIEALSLYSDVVALAQEYLDRTISHVEMEILDGTPYRTIVQFEDGERREGIRLSLIVHFSIRLAVISHLYKRSGLEVVRCPLPMKVRPSTDGGHCERIRSFFQYRGYQEIDFLKQLEHMSRPVFETGYIADAATRSEYIQRQGARGKYAIEAGAHPSSLSILGQGPILVPGSEFLQIGIGTLPVASFTSPPKDLAPMLKNGGDAFFHSHIGDATPEEEAAGKEAMVWIESFCAHFFWRTGRLLSIRVEDSCGKNPISIRCSIKGPRGTEEPGCGELMWELSFLLKSVIRECVSRSGGLRFPTAEGTFHDGCGHISCYEDRTFTANPDLVSPKTSGHMRLMLAERAKAPSWMSLGSRRKISQALKLF